MFNVPITRRPTLKELKQATSVELLVYIRDVLLKQGEASMGAAGYCAYRGDDGKVCAVGALIHGRSYTPEMEDKVVVRLGGIVPSFYDAITPHLRPLTRAQDIHDDMAPILWEDEFDALIADEANHAAHDAISDMSIADLMKD